MHDQYRMLARESDAPSLPAPLAPKEDTERGFDLLYHDYPADVDVVRAPALQHEHNVAKPRWISRPKRRWLRWHPMALGALFLLVLPRITIIGARGVENDILHWLRHHLLGYGDHHEDFHIDTPNNCITYAAWNTTADARTHTRNRAYYSTAVFELPVSPNLYFQSRGASSLIGGSIDFTDDGSAGSDVVFVEVTASYDNADEFGVTQTCWLQPQFSGLPRKLNGVGIFGPDERYTPSDSAYSVLVSFDIKVRFPRRPANPLPFDSLHTSLPNFAHHVSDFHNSVNFASFTLNSRGLQKTGCEQTLEGAPITVDSFSGKWASFWTDDAEISGNFQVTRGLNLFAGRSLVNANITLVNSDDQPPTALRLENSLQYMFCLFFVSCTGSRTRNDHDTNVTLISADKSGSGGAYDVHVIGDSSPVTVGIPYAPLDSILKFEAIGMNATLHATMPPAFEGTVFVTDQPSTPVLVNSSAEDPAHFGRERVVDVRRFSDSIQGSVAWQQPDMERWTRRSRGGSVVVHGIDSTAVLVL
ncbi:hypothetical protein B0H21DRAFT_308421 [Amylocystis lapponica]|nr:hypothetical protein B0H21DRAFT_308421 [Amylocystis lapponica]